MGFAVTRITIYARVYTLNGQNPEMQLAEIREHASRRAGQLPGACRHWQLSSKEDRPKLNRMLENAHSRRSTPRRADSYTASGNA